MDIVGYCNRKRGYSAELHSAFFRGRSTAGVSLIETLRKDQGRPVPQRIQVEDHGVQQRDQRDGARPPFRPDPRGGRGRRDLRASPYGFEGEWEDEEEDEEEEEDNLNPDLRRDKPILRPDHYVVRGNSRRCRANQTSFRFPRLNLIPESGI
jgi:hypothetical protein